MEKIEQADVLFCYENNLFDELSTLETILKLTKNTCFEQEASANYYDLTGELKFNLSEERNHYINLLSIALEKVSVLKKINKNIESEIYYSL